MIKSSSGFDTYQEAFKDAARFIGDIALENEAMLGELEAVSPSIRWEPFQSFEP